MRNSVGLVMRNSLGLVMRNSLGLVMRNSVGLVMPILPNSHPHLFVVYPVLTNEEMATQSQQYNRFIRNGGNAIPKHAGPEAKGSNLKVRHPRCL